MTYHRRNKKKINKTAVVIVVVLLILFFFGPSVKGVTNWISNPIIKTKNAVTSPFKASVEYFKFKQTLIDENENLKAENRKLKIENLTVGTLKEENDSLREILNYQENPQELFVSKVLSQPPFSPYDTFLIDISDNQTEIGSKVYYSNVVLGEIEEIYQKNAVVRLYSSANQNIFVNISDQQVEASGIGGNGFVISLPKDIEINEGEVIYVGDTPIGQVDSIENDQTGAFQNIYFRYPFNINDIDFVQVEENNYVE